MILLDDLQVKFFQTLVGRVAAPAGQALTTTSRGETILTRAGINDPVVIDVAVRTLHAMAARWFRNPETRLIIVGWWRSRYRDNVRLCRCFFAGWPCQSTSSSISYEEFSSGWEPLLVTRMRPSGSFDAIDRLRLKESHHATVPSAARTRRADFTFLAVFVSTVTGVIAPPLRAAETSTPPVLEPSKKQSPAAQKPREMPLFDGKTLDGWRIIDKFDFRRHGKVFVQDQTIFLEQGQPATGISWKSEFPRINYELRFQAQRVEGSDFFCGLTFPVKEEHCTLILGGWGGSVVGLSNIDSYSAVENETTTAIEFEQKRWYTVRLQVTEQRIIVWVDDEKTIDLETRGREFSIYWEQEPVTPLGLVTWNTTGAVRKLQLKRLSP